MGFGDVKKPAPKLIHYKNVRSAEELAEIEHGNIPPHVTQEEIILPKPRKAGLDTGDLTQAELDVCLNQWQETHKRAKNSHGFEHIIWEKLEARKA